MTDTGKERAMALVKESLECLEAASRIADQLIDPGPEEIKVPKAVTRYRNPAFMGSTIDWIKQAEDYQRHLESKAQTLAILAEVVRYNDGPW